MKSKKILIIAALLMIVGFSTHAFADPAWYFCNVESTGTTSDGISFVELTEVNGAWGPVSFIFSSDAAKEQLALSITAQINNNQVQVFVDPAVQWSLVNLMIMR